MKTRTGARASGKAAKVWAPMKWAIAICNEARAGVPCLLPGSAVQRALDQPTASTTAARIFRVSGSRWISVMGKDG